MSKTWLESRNMYIKSSYVQILCLVSYMLRLFFQKITWIYANWDKNKDVQNKVLNVYCILYSICLIRRVNVFILQVGFGVEDVNVYSGLCQSRWLISLYLCSQGSWTTLPPIDSTFKPKTSTFQIHLSAVFTFPLYDSLLHFMCLCLKKILWFFFFLH